ncbi:HAMP domain-containing sensor histidine kinase [uncultured Clostridium sp.]|jgi:signal transduction histidine kinase|uniref:sensor histidine kinase n=1 Tax=uncultured Clostridium sp. TaxID=59620 RepID=UPI002627B3E7|nr:HAMP domain-containing sensor histidine kinase [uncultured Clostridium sp.]
MILILSSIIVILIIILISSFYLQKAKIRELRKNLDFIVSSDTNKEITTSTFDKELIAIAKDINQILRKNKENDIKLRKMQKALKTTIVSIAHDLRTPLTSISGYLQLIEKGNISEEKKTEYVKVINGRISIVQKMLDLLFEFIRLENDDINLEVEKVNVDDILRDTLAVYYCDFIKKMGNKEPKIIIPEKKIVLYGDKSALTRVFNNIIYNSLIHGENYYRIELEETDKEIIISFANETSSIEVEDVEFIFDRFFTADKSKLRKTTGLGLSISKLLVEKMNGNISANINNRIFEIKIKLRKNNIDNKKELINRRL